MRVVGLLALACLLTACDDNLPSRGGKGPLNDIIGVGGGAGINSQLHRARGTTVLNAQQETMQATKLPTGYHSNSMLELSDDGTAGNSVIFMGRPTVDCGLAPGLSGLNARLSDCASKNPQHSQWVGAANGNAGEGNWRLVARQESGTTSKEIWLDESTGFLWGPLVTTSGNWCQAANNDEGPVSEGGINCTTLHDGNSRCEGRALLDIPASEIAWRLPTRGDFLQADLNGARFVLPQQQVQVWSATVNASNREAAWAITPKTGELTSLARSEARAVRCLGRRLK